MAPRQSQRAVKAPERYEMELGVSEYHALAAVRRGMVASVADVDTKVLKQLAKERRVDAKEQRKERARAELLERRREAAEREAARRMEIKAAAATPRTIAFARPERAREVELPPTPCHTDDGRASRKVDEEARLRPKTRGDVVDVCSEFSGIGALEFGLEAGTREVGLTLRLVEASELNDTSVGRHATAVLHKRFPHCTVLGPTSRDRLSYPETADLLTVTPICTQHSGCNAHGDPDVTEATLERVFARLRRANGIEVVVFENVPNFLGMREGQERSSYALWIDGLEECGFCEHAYAVMPTRVVGDLHYRSRVLSVHTRGAFHPAAALLRLLTADPPAPAAAAPPADARNDVMAFTTGIGEKRYAAIDRGVRAVYGHLPAYSRALNVGLHFDGALYCLSPKLAARASGLPDDYQDVNSSEVGGKVVGVEMSAGRTKAAGGLANMVSPLQARELGAAVAAEWLAPRRYDQVAALADCPRVPGGYCGHVPDTFPRGGRGGQAMLCFNRRSSRRWHTVSGLWWLETAPERSLAALCADARDRGELKLLRSLVDLGRVADDTAVPLEIRETAKKQARKMVRAAQRASARGANAKPRARAARKRPRPHGPAPVASGGERKRKRPRADKAVATKMPVCTEPSPSCAVTLGNVRRWAVKHAEPCADRMTWVACDACGKWRRVPAAVADRAEWTCPLGDDPAHASCEVAQELPDAAIDQQVDDDTTAVTLVLRGPGCDRQVHVPEHLETVEVVEVVGHTGTGAAARLSVKLADGRTWDGVAPGALGGSAVLAAYVKRHPRALGRAAASIVALGVA